VRARAGRQQRNERRGERRGCANHSTAKPARGEKNRGHELEPKPGHSEAILDWKRRMGVAQGKEIYKQRASTSETINADLRTQRGLRQILVRGSKKAKYALGMTAEALVGKPR